MAARKNQGDGESRIGAQEREILRAQRRIVSVLSVADLMALMMVIVTALSAFATWRTEQVSELIFAVSDRPIIGVEDVTFQRVDTDEPAIVVDFRNFGPIPADGAIITVSPLLDGKAIALHGSEIANGDQGIVSPTVPHLFYTFVHSEEYKRATSGASQLTVRIRVDYEGPDLQRHYCYNEKAFYDSRLGLFRSAGGTTRCGNADIF